MPVLAYRGIHAMNAVEASKWRLDTFEETGRTAEGNVPSASPAPAYST
jgi:hypothetical protein